MVEGIPYHVYLETQGLGKFLPVLISDEGKGQPKRTFELLPYLSMIGLTLVLVSFLIWLIGTTNPADTIQKKILEDILLRLERVESLVKELISAK